VGSSITSAKNANLKHGKHGTQTKCNSIKLAKIKVKEIITQTLGMNMECGRFEKRLLKTSPQVDLDFYEE